MAQLKTGIWVDALIRRAQVAGAFACVVLRGDRDAGSVLVGVRGRETLTLYTPERDMDGQRVWRGERLDEDGMRDRIASRRDFDSDLIVVEIDDADGRHFIEETVIEPPCPPVIKSAAPDRTDAITDTIAETGTDGEARPVGSRAGSKTTPKARSEFGAAAAAAAAAAEALFRDR